MFQHEMVASFSGNTKTEPFRSLKNIPEEKKPHPCMLSQCTLSEGLSPKIEMTPLCVG